MAQREVAGPSLESLERIDMEEAEALAETAAVFRHRAPEGLVFRVVVHDDDFKPRVVETRERIERLSNQLGRLAVRGDVQRDEWRDAVGVRLGGPASTPAH